jgi:hypothetical protein
MKFRLQNCQSFFNLDDKLYSEKVNLLKSYGFKFQKIEHFGWKNSVHCDNSCGNDIEINTIEDLMKLQSLFKDELIIGNDYIIIYDDYRE